MRIHRDVAHVLAAEVRLGRAVLQEVASHPVILAGAGEVLDLFPQVAPMQLGAALAGGGDQADGKSRVVRHRHQCRLAVARHALDADALCINALVGLEIVEPARCTPGPCAQRSPVVGLARLAVVDQADDAFGQPRAVVSLDACRTQRGVAPSSRNQLFGRRRIAARAAPQARLPGAAPRAPPGAGPRPRGAGPPSATGSVPPPNMIITGTGPLALAGVTSVIWMSTFSAG